MADERPASHDPEDETETTAPRDEPSGTSWAPTPPSGTPPLPAWVPRRLGQYTLRRQIGAGGMATVFEAVQEQPRRTVAVKIMQRGVASKSSLRRFEYEAQLLARLRHPNIAQVYEASTHMDGDEAIPFFVMEYIPNARRITEYARKRELTVREKVHLFARVCDAVHHGHQRGIIHRDLKPGNIMVDSNGDPKVIDFGVARATDSDLAVTTLQTDIGQLVGTVQYMSPEQCEADPNDLDTRSDVYALGVVLYELLCERLPYELPAGNIIRATQIVREQPPTPPSSLMPRLRGDLELIVLKALQKNREDRYQTAHELQQDLERYLRDEPITAQPPTLLYVLRSRFRAVAHRHPAALLILVIIFAATFVDRFGESLVFQWTPLHRLAERAWATWAGTVDLDRLEHVRIVQIAGDAGPRIDAIARSLGLEDVDYATNYASRRRIHGRLFEQLALARAGSVTYCGYFEDFAPDEHNDAGALAAFDADFVAGVEALQNAGADVVVGTSAWPLDGRPVVGAALAPHVGWGGPTHHFTPTADWNLHLAVRRTGAPIPSFALRTHAAFNDPGWTPSFSIAEDGKAITLAPYRLPDPNDPARRIWRDGPPDVIDVSYTKPYGVAGDDPYGRRPDDLVSVFRFTVPDRDCIDASSVTYEEVLEADEHWLRERLQGRAVVITTARWEERSIPHPTGIAMSWGIGYAVGIDALLSGRVRRTEVHDARFPFLVLPGGAIVGVLIGIIATGRPVRRVVLLVVAGFTIFLASVLAARHHQFLFDPWMIMIATLVASELTAVIMRVRRARSV
jgi:serine/threonine protein kinase